MFFFFVCSLSPHFTRLRTSPTRCPTCLDPSPTVYQYKKQNRLSIFFIPVWWFNSGDIWHCENCNWEGRAKPEEEQIRRSEETEMVQQLGPLPTWGLTRCRNCNKEINVSGRIKYCPYCGDSVEG